MFNVFLSHAVEQSDFVREVALAMEEQNLAPFMASRDIPKGAEWLPNLEDALQSAEALAAFLTPDFRQSDWCDQEIGYALGRQRPVVPLQLADGLRPYGYLARYQLVETIGLTPPEVAKAIFDTLYVRTREQRKLTASVLHGLLNERRVEFIRLWANRLAVAQGQLTSEDLKAAQRALRQNTVLRTDRIALSLMTDILPDDIQEA